MLDAKARARPGGEIGSYQGVLTRRERRRFIVGRPGPVFNAAVSEAG